MKRAGNGVPEQLGLLGYLPFVFEVAGSSVAVAATARVRTVMTDLTNIVNIGKDCRGKGWTLIFKSLRWWLMSS